MRRLRDLLIVRAQIKFFRDNRAGCAFAAFAARNPKKYGWAYRVIQPSSLEIDRAIEEAIRNPEITTLSLVFRKCSDEASLQNLVRVMQECDYLFLEQNEVFGGCRCLGFRVRFDNLVSWVSGFGPFPFFPETRQTPHTEIAFRVKLRPPYTKVVKEAPEGVIHLADMEMKGMTESDFKVLWHASMDRTAKILGHKPNLLSAAKTTFVVPAE